MSEDDVTIPDKSIVDLVRKWLYIPPLIVEYRLERDNILFYISLNWSSLEIITPFSVTIEDNNKAKLFI